MMTSVPRIWEKVYGTIHEGLKTASPVKAKMFNWAEKVALQVYRNNLAGKKSGVFLRIQHSLADALVMKKYARPWERKTAMFTMWEVQPLPRRSTSSSRLLAST